MSERGWSLGRAVLLAMAAVVLSPVNPLVLVAVPVAVLLLAFRPSDLRAGGIAVLLLVVAFMGPAEGRNSLWYVERGWALVAGGCFVAATLWAGVRSPIVGRGLLGVAGGLAGLSAVALFRPSFPAQLDHWVGGEFERAAAGAYQLVGSLGGGAMDRSLEWALFDWVDLQVALYPALLALATLAALGVGWYVVRRLSGASEALPPLREFRFNDHLVWLLIAGIVLLLVPWGGLWSRAGENAVVFMGGIYLLRGLGIILWIGAATVSSAWSAALWALAGLLLYPLAAGAALILGLCDTWWDIRERFRTSPV